MIQLLVFLPDLITGLHDAYASTMNPAIPAHVPNSAPRQQSLFVDLMLPCPWPCVS